MCIKQFSNDRLFRERWRVIPGEKLYQPGELEKFVKPGDLTGLSLEIGWTSFEYIRGGCRGLPLLPMQHPEMAHINFQSCVFVSKNAENKILKLDQSSYGCSETLTSVGGYNFSCCPVFSTVRDSVQCTERASLFSYNQLHELTYQFSEQLDASCSKTMAFRMIEEKQQYVFQECKKNNRKDNFEKYLLDKLAALLNDCFRNGAGV